MSEIIDWHHNYIHPTVCVSSESSQFSSESLAFCLVSSKLLKIWFMIWLTHWWLIVACHKNCKPHSFTAPWKAEVKCRTNFIDSGWWNQIFSLIIIFDFFRKWEQKHSSFNDKATTQMIHSIAPQWPIAFQFPSLWYTELRYTVGIKFVFAVCSYVAHVPHLRCYICIKPL